MRRLQLEDVVVGQYKGHSKGGKTYLGYTEDPTVPSHSLTPTFAAAALFIDNARWDGVHFLMKADKTLNTRRFIFLLDFFFARTCFSPFYLQGRDQSSVQTCSRQPIQAKL